MNFNEIFSDPKAVELTIKSIEREVRDDKKYRIMEVCGTHTMSIAKYGIPSILPKNIELVSGPGCPVCVTSQADIDNCIDLAKDHSITITTFGDMLKVMGSGGVSLYDAKAEGADVRIIYSPLDTVEMAKANPSRKFVFLAVGFETTTPMAAALVKAAHAQNLENVSVLSLCKTMPAAFNLLLNDKDTNIDGFLCPGNVSIITGSSIYEPIVKSGKAAVIAGFEPMDILSSILEAVRQINSGKFKVVNNYYRACSDKGNLKAKALTDEIFEPSDSRWRGLGVLKNSGMRIRERYSTYDAAKVFGINSDREEKPTPCKCGEILKGVRKPNQCPLFAKVCTPLSAVGPCMVSSEGSCAAYYKYARHSL